ncbi:lytic transglycosylase domain-containing protein [Sandarakinorhabdus sp.]|uniref:lytic transglycosylase domain-containing protein n=1 Tax=Sandarakinorhabdus sp. TaxID=1916663 RepID=UPI00334230A1
MKRTAIMLTACIAAMARADSQGTQAPVPMQGQAQEQAQVVTGQRSGITARQRMVPPQLTDSERVIFRQIYLDLDAGRFVRAEAAIAAQPPGLLSQGVQAALVVARGPGQLTRADLAGWLAGNFDQPLAAKVAKRAEAMPGTDSAPLPLLPEARAFRTTASNIAGTSWSAERGTGDAELAALLRPLLAADRNDEAEQIWLAQSAKLSPPARSFWAARIAWNHYRMGDDLAAWRIGLDSAATGWQSVAIGGGPGAADGAWAAGLAAFRLGRWRDAAAAFDLVTAGPDDARAAAHFWAARSFERAGDAAARLDRLHRAAASRGSFYGLLSRRTLGLDQALDWAEPDFITADWNYLKEVPGARRAAALVEIGQLGLADRELRHLAATAPADAYPAILRLAARLDLPATQYSLAIRPPIGLEAPLSARFPAPEWVPARGWRLPKSLIFAHALQESAFITTATSRTGARGLMQLMPDTRDLVHRRIRRETPDDTQASAAVIGDITDPAFNIELGQTYLEMLGNMGITGGLLPKVIAAYNAGPGAVLKWNSTLDDQGDPLLFIESIPYRETRQYVRVVMRNLWMYELRENGAPASMDAVAQGLWPRLPGIGGPLAVKREALAIRPRPQPGSFAPEAWPSDNRAIAGGK